MVGAGAPSSSASFLTSSLPSPPAVPHEQHQDRTSFGVYRFKVRWNERARKRWRRLWASLKCRGPPSCVRPFVSPLWSLIMLPVPLPPRSLQKRCTRTATTQIPHAASRTSLSHPLLSPAPFPNTKTARRRLPQPPHPHPTRSHGSHRRRPPQPHPPDRPTNCQRCRLRRASSSSSRSR